MTNIDTQETDYSVYFDAGLISEIYLLLVRIAFFTSVREFTEILNYI